MCLSCLAAVNQPSLEDKATILRALPCISPRLLSITPLPHTRDARVRLVDLLGPLIETSEPLPRALILIQLTCPAEKNHRAQGKQVNSEQVYVRSRIEQD
jgi:hypothetical protein